MLFKEELAQKIVEGKKTQTRRPIKQGEKLLPIDGVKTVMAGNGKRIKYQVGREYSIQYGRGLPTRMYRDNDAHLLPLDDYLKYKGVLFEGSNLDVWTVNDYVPLKIRLLDIWGEDVRGISEKDAIAEGFEHPEITAYWGFIETWASFYDKPVAKLMKDSEAFHAPLLAERPINLYQAWALKFELVK